MTNDFRATGIEVLTTITTSADSFAVFQAILPALKYDDALERWLLITSAYRWAQTFQTGAVEAHFASSMGVRVALSDCHGDKDVWLTANEKAWDERFRLLIVAAVAANDAAALAVAS